MDSNSIVSFGNDSTYPAGIVTDNNDLSVHDLALHAMRDRCLLLQRRIQCLEDENMKLRLEKNKPSEGSLNKEFPSNIVHHLERIAELTKQKSQLMNHINMVSTENRNLWSKLGSLKLNKVDNTRSQLNFNQNKLVRSNTYITDSSPKKDVIEKLPEPSLEEISLKLMDGYIKEKSQLVEQLEEFSQLQHLNANNCNMDSVRFTYLEEEQSLEKLKLGSGALESLKNELLQQESDLKNLITQFSKLKEKPSCQQCEARQSKLMTSSVQTHFEESNGQWGTPNTSVTGSEKNTSGDNLDLTKTKVEHFHICPLCGKGFNLDNVIFEDFQKHVEEHFIMSNDVDGEQNMS